MEQNQFNQHITSYFRETFHETDVESLEEFDYSIPFFIIENLYGEKEPTISELCDVKIPAIADTIKLFCTPLERMQNQLRGLFEYNVAVNKTGLVYPDSACQLSPFKKVELYFESEKIQRARPETTINMAYSNYKSASERLQSIQQKHGSLTDLLADTKIRVV